MSADPISAFAALAQDTRLRLLQLLSRSGSDGLAAGAAGTRLGIRASSLSFHLKELESAGLIKARRRGRQIFYAADLAALGRVVKFLVEEMAAARPVLRVPIR